MDWKQAINRNREGLVGVIAGLVPLVAAAREAPHPRILCRFISRILRPAEAALRRLIVIVAAALLAKPASPSRGRLGAKTPLPDFAAFGQGQKLPAFPLIDPRKGFGMTGKFAGFARVLPRISVPGVTKPFRPAKQDGAFNAAALLRRIARLESALKTLPKQARRLNRLMARRAVARPGPGRAGPIRPGLPPGHRKRPRHPVDDILSECHFLARGCGFKPP